MCTLRKAFVLPVQSLIPPSMVRTGEHAYTCTCIYSHFNTSTNTEGFKTSLAIQDDTHTHNIQHGSSLERDQYEYTYIQIAMEQA